MKNALSLFVFLVITTCSFAQHQLSGIVLDGATSSPIKDAHVALNGNSQMTVTDAEGKFKFSLLKNEVLSISIFHIGYEAMEISYTAFDNEPIIVRLTQKTHFMEEVIISAVRASNKSATTNMILEKDDLAERNLGQDLPELLKMTPSFVNTSDAGAGIGYTGFRIRGSDPTRINMTINGIPYNDSESQGLFLVDLPDFTSSIENLQIQRGVGTSTNGAGAFGASINIKTNDFRKEAFAKTSHSFGSFNTRKHNIQLGSGLINDHFFMEARTSIIESDGFIDRATSDLKSLYVSGGYSNNNQLIKAVVITGKERTYQAWNGVPEAFIDTNRTYNIYTYDNQVDDYQQDHYQLHYANAINNMATANLAFHYTKGQGFFEEYKESDLLSNYNLSPVILGSDTIRNSDVIRRRWLDNDFYGFTYALEFQKNGWQNQVGGAWNQYDGQHFGEVIWARFSSNGAIRHRYYDNNAEKTDFNVFNKLNYDWNDKLILYLDLQFRQVNYAFLGFDEAITPTMQDVSFKFFNPKLGINFIFNDQLRSYFSFAVANREPNRSDFVDSSTKSRPSHESLYNAELGIDWSTAQSAVSANLFYMHYENQLLLTGGINDVGAYTRVNTPKSYRAGIELQAAHQFNEILEVNGNVSLSSNRIEEYTELTDNFDTGLQEVMSFKDTDLAFSPEWVSSLQIRATPTNHTELSLLSKYVSDQYLDNTANEQRKLDGYFTTDAIVKWNVKNSFAKHMSLKLLVNNLFDTKYESNGYTFGYIYGGERVQENWYYPQAGIHALFGLDVSF